MAILKNTAFANKSLVTAYGKIEFNENGISEVKDFVAKKLANLKGFTVEESDENLEVEEVVEEETTEEVEEIEEELDEVEENEKTSVTREELEALTVKQLEKFAKENEIDLAGATKKADIISVILGE